MDISKSVQRFQLAISDARVRLDLAISPGKWLMPSDLLLSTQNTVGYDKILMKATADMKLRVNKSINLGMKPIGVRHMDEGPLKINILTSHSSNPVHKRLQIGKEGER